MSINLQSVHAAMATLVSKKSDKAVLKPVTIKNTSVWRVILYE